jgi:hypothetical protein
LPKTAPSSLDARLHSRQREAGPRRRFADPNALDLDEPDGFAVRLTEPLDDGREACRHVGTLLRIVSDRRLRSCAEVVEVQGIPRRHFARERARAVVVGDGPASRSIEPGMDALIVPDLTQATVHLQEDPLDDVVHVGRIRDPASDERAETVAELDPQRTGVRPRARRVRLPAGYLHPHRFPGASPQHDVLADGAQQDACSCGPQQLVDFAAEGCSEFACDPDCPVVCA